MTGMTGCISLRHRQRGLLWLFALGLLLLLALALALALPRSVLALRANALSAAKVGFAALANHGRATLQSPIVDRTEEVIAGGDALPLVEYCESGYTRESPSLVCTNRFSAVSDSVSSTRQRVCIANELVFRPAAIGACDGEHGDGDHGVSWRASCVRAKASFAPIFSVPCKPSSSAGGTSSVSVAVGLEPSATVPVVLTGQFKSHETRSPKRVPGLTIFSCETTRTGFITAFITTLSRQRTTCAD